MAAGTYTCTITDANGCTKSQSATITQPTAITSSISSQTNVSCNGGTNGSATVSATGGTAPYTYLWSNGAATASVTELAAGTYNCYVTDANGCLKTQSVIITQPSAINATVTQTTGVLTATQSGATYQWYTCPNSLIIGATNQSYTPILAGNYKVAITIGGCTIESNCVTVSSTLGINDFEVTSKPLFLVFPNPTSGVLNVKSSFDGRFKLYNLLGQAKMSFDFVSDKENSFSMESLPAGIYFLKGINGDKIYSEKILLKK